MLKLLVIEDHALVREGLVRLLGQLEENVKIFEAADFEAALNLLDEEDDFDLVLLDLGLPGVDGFRALDIFRRRYSAMPVVVVSAFDDAASVTRSLGLGASGFIPKAYSGESLLAAIRSVLAGNVFRPQTAIPTKGQETLPMRPAQNNLSPLELGLTERQAQVLALMVQGMSNRDIGNELGLSEGTVKIHVTAIFKALGVQSRTQAMVAVARYSLDFDKVF